MGMFNWVDYECECPNCGFKVWGFQTKDGQLDGSIVPPNFLHNFYSTCANCGLWVEYERNLNTGELQLIRPPKWMIKAREIYDKMSTLL